MSEVADSSPGTAVDLISRAGVDSAPPELIALTVGLLGGLALFLFGLDQMTGALKAVAGERLRTVLATLTVNRFAAVGTGAFVTSIIQSSSVTTVLVIGFISSGLMSLSQAVGIIFGANIGTTVTAQIIAFKVTKLSLALVAAGFALSFAARRETLRHHGAGILGLGLVFLGMTVMSEAMAPLRHYPPFIEWMVRFETPLIGILASAIFTGLVQSSSATTGIVIAMASQGLLTVPAGIALIFGANIGTCVTALLAAIGKPREAVRAAFVHLAFNVGGVLLWVAFIDNLAEWVIAFSPRSLDLQGAERMAADTPRQIANAHTLFNISNTLIFLPFSALLARVVERLVPDRPISEDQEVRARFLDDSLLTTPAIALDCVRRELVHLGELVQRMLEDVLPAILASDRDALRELQRMDDDVDRLYANIIEYLGRISEGSLTQAETSQLLQLMSIANALESAGDTIETDLVGRRSSHMGDHVSISPATIKVISEFHLEVSRAMQSVVTAIDHRDSESAQRVVDMKPLIQRLADTAARHQAQRLVAKEGNRLPTYAAEVDIIEELRRVYYYAKRIARVVLESEAERSGS
jgi:phosphate:Na+ symporter